MIPPFNVSGKLPEGIHCATWREVCDRFCTNTHRRELLFALATALVNLKAANCATIYIDGSFVTAKEFPHDVDVLWDPTNVNFELLDQAFFCTEAGRRRQQLLYRGDYFPSVSREGISGISFLDFFQNDRETGMRKGIVQLKLETFP